MPTASSQLRGKKRPSDPPSHPKRKKRKPDPDKPSKPVPDIRFVKCPLRNILDPESSLWAKIQTMVPIISELTTNAYLLLNLHIRRLLGQNLPVPKITDKYLRMFFYIFYPSKGKISPDILETYSLYMRSFPKLTTTVPMGLIDGACSQMTTAINNNIQIHFFKRQHKYLWLNHPEMTSAQIKVMQDEINNSPGPHITLPENRDPEINMALLLKRDPSSFLKPMYLMLQYIKDEQKRCLSDPTLPNVKRISKAAFALLPMRRSFVPGSIAIDSTTLARLMSTDPAAKTFMAAKVKKVKSDPKDKTGNSLSDSEEAPEEIEESPKVDKHERYTALWASHFNLGEFMRRKKRRFDYRILTDGVSACVQLRGPKNLPPEPDEDSVFGISLPHFTPEQLKNKTVVGIDPGMISLLYITSDVANPEYPTPQKPVRLEYRKAQREHDLHIKEFENERLHMKALAKLRGVDVIALETHLSQTDGRAASVEEYHKYVQAHQAVAKALYEHYSDERYRVMNFISFRGKQKSESKLVNEVKTKWGNDAVFAFGDWKRRKQMKGMSSVPLTRMRKVIKKAFQYVVDVPEFRTTVTCSKCRTGEMCEAFEDCKVRGLRRCNNEECGVLMARDYNAAMNIKLNLEHWISHGVWDPAFTRQGSGAGITVNTNKNEALVRLVASG